MTSGTLVKKDQGYIYALIVNGLVYIGSSSYNDRLKQHITELYKKAKEGEEMSRKLFKEIETLICDIKCFIKDMTFHYVYNYIKMHPNFEYKVIVEDIESTTLKQYEQLYIDKYNSIANGLNTNRAYIDSELLAKYKREYDEKLMESNPVRRCFRKHIANIKKSLSKILDIDYIHYTIHSNHNLKVEQINKYITNLEKQPSLYGKYMLETMLSYRRYFNKENQFKMFISQNQNEIIKKMLILILNTTMQYDYFNLDYNCKKDVVKNLQKQNIFNGQY